MATCDTLEVDLSRVDLDITLEQYPCIDVEVLQPDIVIDIGTVANQGPKGDKGDQGVAGPPGDQGVAGPPGQQGLPGNAATIAVGGTVTGAPGSSATVTNSGSSSAAVFNFSIPAGVQGATGGTGAQGNPGTPGAAATIAVGTTATGAPGSNASVTNSGSSSAAIFNFTIPRGDVGPQGPQGPSGSGTGDMLKSVYDTNSNNIVDAAESVPWTGVTGKPATFSPSAHASTHLSAGSDPIAIATSVLAGLCPAVDNTTIQVVASKLSAVSLAWTAITGRPSTFPPDSTAMLKSVYDTNADNIVDHAALADTTPWTGITGVPATFAPSAHQASHVTGTDQIPSAGTSARGLMAQANNNPNAFYASDATQKQVTYAMLGGSQPGPIAHASTHVTGGTDVIVPASASTAGLLKQLSGNTTDFVDGTNACHALAPAIWKGFLGKTAAYTLTTADSGKYVICSGGSWTLTLPAPAAGLVFQVRNDMGISGTTGTITLSPTGGTVDGLSSIALLPQQECTLITDGTNWRTFGLKREVILGTQDITTSTASGSVLLPVGYRYFELEFSAVVPVTANAGLIAKLSVNGGSTWIITGYYHGTFYNPSATTAAYTDIENDTSFYLVPGNAVGQPAISKLVIYPGSSTLQPTWTIDAIGRQPSYEYKWNGGGILNAVGQINALQYLMNSGNIATSFLTVKGVV